MIAETVQHLKDSANIDMLWVIVELLGAVVLGCLMFMWMRRRH